MALSRQDLLNLKPGALLLTKKEWSRARPGPGAVVMFVKFDNNLINMWALTGDRVERYILKKGGDGLPVSVFNEHFEVVQIEKK